MLILCVPSTFITLIVTLSYCQRFAVSAFFNKLGGPGGTVPFIYSIFQETITMSKMNFASLESHTQPGTQAGLNEHRYISGTQIHCQSTKQVPVLTTFSCSTATFSLTKLLAILVQLNN